MPTLVRRRNTRPTTSISSGRTTAPALTVEQGRARLQRCLSVYPRPIRLGYSGGRRRRVLRSDHRTGTACLTSNGLYEKAPVVGDAACVGARGRRSRLFRHASQRQLPTSRAGPATVERVAHEVLVRSQGLIVAATTIEVKSRASGLVQAVHATAGDRVRTGQVLLEVDPARSRLNEEEMRNEVENARSQVRLAEESIDPDRVALAQRKLTRARELSKEGLTTREAIEQAEYDFAAAERTVRNQRQQLEAAQRRLEIALTRQRRSEIESTFTVIRSPIDGVVLSRAVEIGSGVTSFSDSAQGGTVLFKIGSLDRLAFDGNLAMSDLTKIKPGLAARVTSDAWREPAAGVVSYVAQEAVAPTQSVGRIGRPPFR